ncbi:MAG: hypothetical protein ACOVT5_13215, partial [Armatimonadaceae bacterium]
PRLLTATFVHAQGVGPSTEVKLWESGVLHWDHCTGPKPEGVSRSRWETLKAIAEQSSAALARRDHRWFAQAIPASEHWRLLPWFADKMLFVDIETNGGYDADDITIVGLYDGFESRILVQGRDLEEFPSRVSDTELLVTFFGAGFLLMRGAFRGGTAHPVIPFAPQGQATAVDAGRLACSCSARTATR